MGNRIIRKVAVLGSGVMGSRIAAHFAGTGVQVLLLDIVPQGIADNASAQERNKIVNDSLASALKSSPSPVYHKEATRLIQTGNFSDNMKDIATCDWVIEVVVERLDIKKKIYEEVEKYRKPGTLVSSNTSGIPIHLMSEGRSEDFRKNFCGTHFFNPPRYLRLLEIIPGPDTDPSVISFLLHYGDLYLGKTTVLCKDTPAFIANRIGVFSMMKVFQLTEKLELTPSDIDILTGPVAGRPKSATYRTADIVGIDTLVKVANGVQQACLQDEARDIFAIPAWLQKMTDAGMLGDKSGKGFYLKKKSADGSKEILEINFSTLEYGPVKKTKFATIEAARQTDDPEARLKILMSGKDKAGQFYREFHFALFEYICRRIPEISDEIYRIDDAMRAGFGWDAGPFETWDMMGVKKTAEEMKKAGHTLPDWMNQFLEAGHSSFYITKDNRRLCYDPLSVSYKSIPGSDAFIVLRNYAGKTIWTNGACKVYDTGDEVLALEWNTKMGSIGGEVLEGIQRAVGLAEEKYKGLVIANSGANFSAGANVALIFMMAAEQDYDELEMAIRIFQDTMMRVRYSAIPVVVAPHGLALGGSCELCLHADKIVAAAETYTGMVEAGIGVIPGGGGTKEFVVRAADEMHPGEPETITLQNRFINIATAKVSTSAHEAYDLGIYRKGKDEVSINMDRRIGMAREAVLQMHESGYVMPVRRDNVKVLGRSALGALYAGINGMRRGGYASGHDALVARKLAYVMCGGDLSEPATVSEQYLLDLEREAFLSLACERKSLERMQSVLKTGKPIRN